MAVIKRYFIHSFVMQFVHHDRGQRQAFLKRSPLNYQNDRFMFNINMHWMYLAEILNVKCPLS